MYRFSKFCCSFFCLVDSGATHCFVDPSFIGALSSAFCAYSAPFFRSVLLPLKILSAIYYFIYHFLPTFVYSFKALVGALLLHVCAFLPLVFRSVVHRLISVCFSYIFFHL